jgi:hypothetical protein
MLKLALWNFGSSLIGSSPLRAGPLTDLPCMAPLGVWLTRYETALIYLSRLTSLLPWFELARRFPILSDCLTSCVLVAELEIPALA